VDWEYISGFFVVATPDRERMRSDFASPVLSACAGYRRTKLEGIRYGGTETEGEFLANICFSNTVLLLYTYSCTNANNHMQRLFFVSLSVCTIIIHVLMYKCKLPYHIHKMV
jgi:hypothetical protein